MFAARSCGVSVYMKWRYVSCLAWAERSGVGMSGAAMQVRFVRCGIVHFVVT